MWNANSPGFELVSPCPIPATITITPRAPPLVTLKPIVDGVIGTVSKSLEREDWNKNRRRIETIAEIGQNTEESSGELKRLAVTQTAMKDHKLTLVWKTHNEWINNDYKKLVNYWRCCLKGHSWTGREKMISKNRLLLLYNEMKV